MTLAERLIDILVDGRMFTGRPRRGFVYKPGSSIEASDFLSGSDVAALSPRQGILVHGKKGRVIDVEVRGNEVSLTYVKGAKVFGKEITLVFSKTDQKTPIQTFLKSYEDDLDEGITKGMKRAMEKLPRRMTCKECGLVVPVYPGRYPHKCPECSTPFEVEGI